MLNPKQLQQFSDDGFLVIDNVLDLSDINALRAEYLALIDRIAERRGLSHQQVATAGVNDVVTSAAELSSPALYRPDLKWHELDFEQKLTRLLSADPAAYEHLDISLPLREGLDTAAGVHTGPAVFGLLTHPRVLDIVESVIGPEIQSNPVQHVRIKPPEKALSLSGRGNSNMARTGWHQDAAVIVEEADQAPILTVWVAVTDADREMGCMQAIPGSHRWNSLGKHCPGRSGVGEIFIPREIVDEHRQVDLSVKAGAVVLLNKKTWHGAGPNNSARVRWSFDLRYQPPGFNSGRDCFPDFLVRSAQQPEQVVKDSESWARLWETAREEIASGKRRAVFNERWLVNRNDPLCA